jgi:hypothetical protein
MPGAHGHDRISTAIPATELIQSQGAVLTSDQVDSAVADLLIVSRPGPVPSDKQLLAGG